MPHDSTSVSGPVPLSLGLPVPQPADLVDGLIRPIGAIPNVPVLDPAEPEDRIAAFLAGIAHADTGFVIRTDSGERALAVLAATAAALCGEDIRTALTRPDLEFLRALGGPAVAALREVLLAVETAAPEAVAAGLAVLRA
ncbi:hypothetical protein [Nocardia pseudobrasiliensis]|uniref:Uncharacterized protein n=1 Tax=Nocardia pseudobrasiliensis TaxID=45979 RepID=A0A370HT07_9NOCA|nr:hypothetical protein [Nocardia pseudobrasiliensis]RDI61659.1 hypothetical protein DFR76_113161 [Nocardia pseudobrasiliensis]